MSPDERTINEIPIQEIVEHPYGGKRNVIMDATILTGLMACPRLADFRFNHNFVSVGGKSNSLELGSIVHTFLENYYKTIIKGVKREDAFGYAIISAELYIKGCPGCTGFSPIHIHTSEAPDVCTSDCQVKPKCGHRANDYPGVMNTPKDTEKPPHGYRTGWQWALDTCDAYHNFYRSDHWVPLEVEIVKGEILYEDEDVRILWKAKLDLVADTNQGIYPIDHKTMKQNRATNSLNNQFIGQCLLSKTQNVIINKIGFQTTLKPEERFIRQPVSYSTSRLLEWQSETLPYYAKLLLMYAEGSHFPPNYTQCEGKYGNCSFIDVCKADPGMREDVIKQHFVVGQPWNPTNEDE